MKTWFTCKATAKDEAEISIYDEIGLWGITAKEFIDELKALGAVKSITLSINSPGGSVFDGIAIYNALKRHPALITVRIDGVAASMASAIAMVGDHVLMPENAMMMIHDPMGIVVGNSREMKQYAELLDKLKNNLVATYANKTGLEREDIEDMMAAETWLSASEAVEQGFADAIEEPVKVAASFDLSKFKNAPAQAGRKRGPAASTAVQKENPMTDSIDPAIEPETAGPVETPVEIVAEVVTEVPEATPAATPVAAVNSDEITARIRKENAEIAAVCAMQGKGDKAAAFIAEGKSLSDVIAALQADRAAGTELNAHSNVREPDKAATWDKAIAKANAKVPGAK